MTQPAVRTALQLDFLRDIYFVQAQLTFEAMEPLTLPPFAGSTIRGIFGHALKDGLCGDRGACQNECVHPDSCPYFSLFERNREQNEGGNLPKSMILDPPVPPELEEIAMGGEVCFPYEATTAGRQGLAILENPHSSLVPEGNLFHVQVTLLGQAGSLLPILVQVLQTRVLHANGRFRLWRVTDTGLGRRILFERDNPTIPMQPAMRQTLAPLVEDFGEVRKLTVGFVTPLRTRAGDNYCFSPGQLGETFWETCLSRAGKIRDAFCTPSRDRLPWMELPEERPRIAGGRLFKYALPRMSHRQQAFMDFDGLVGHIVFEGRLKRLLPLALAAESLHIGQKATFGLGKIRCVIG
jgi:hypothetical protein